MGCCKHGNTDGDCGLCFAEELADVKASLEQAESENNALRAALYDEHYGITHTLRVALFEEAIEAILNLAPGVRKERGGCFGSQQADCGCTVCKIRRYGEMDMMQNAQHLKTAAQLYEIRDTAKRLLGSKYAEKMAGMGLSIKKVAADGKKNELDAATEICTAIGAEGMEVLMIMAAAVELIEPSNV